VLYSLKEQGHEIDGFGIGTNLVTCQAQPALGGGMLDYVFLSLLPVVFLMYLVQKHNLTACAVKCIVHRIFSPLVSTSTIRCRRLSVCPAVFKLVEVKGQPRIKVSQEPAKVTIPGRKEAFRLYDSQDKPILDLLILSGSTPPVLCALSLFI
jgi:hypothetical protein